jgi:hypothetical protein
MANNSTIIGPNQIPWSEGGGSINLPTVIENKDGTKLNMYFGARPTYQIPANWKDFLFHDIGLLTIDLPLLPPQPTVPGDANDDQIVNQEDFNIWLRNYGQTTSNGTSDADFNTDGKVDGIDFVIWMKNATI